VKASETTFAGFVQGQVQFQVPLYQRTYSWGEPQLQQLWDDIVDQADLLESKPEAPSHFLGSLVLAPSPANEPTFQRWLIVDGQQRLTTLSLALAATRDHTSAAEGSPPDRLNDLYLVNRWQSGERHLRLLPTQADRAAYDECIRRSHGPGVDRISAAYRFFRQRLVAADDPNDPHDVERIEQVITGRLSLVVVTADRDDNVHRIFESLNNTGLRLSQADLLRNYLFMRLPTQAERIYETYWLPLQRRLTNDQLEQLMWLQLVLDGDERVRRQDMYGAQQHRLQTEGESEDAVEQYIKELYRRSAHLQRLLDPTNHEQDAKIREYLVRLRQWRGATAFPAIMLLFDRLERRETTPSEVVRALSYIESFLVRRLICQVPTNNLNRIFQAVPAQLPADQPVADGLRWLLSGTRRSWPTDEELRQAVREKPFYWQGRPEQQRLVLQRLEESFEHPEPVDFTNAALTIEHIMPQTPTQEWLQILAEDATPDESPMDLHERTVQTLGNLTLTGENARLSNHPFDRKQDLYEGSHLEMNQQVANMDRWGPREILTRADELADRALKIWPAPLVSGHRVERSRNWTLLHQALAAMPDGAWTTYSDLAALIGSHPVPIGTHLANTPGITNAHRVLTANGRASESFRWPGPDRGDLLVVLREEGVKIDETGAADPAQRLSARDLADLLGLTELPPHAEVSPDESDPPLSERFGQQLIESNPPEVVEGVHKVLRDWVAGGGSLGYGRGTTVTSCFLMLDRPILPQICPLIIYPTWGRVGYAEIGFKYLATREPFDDASLREEFRRRLEEVPDVEIPPSKLELRPSFPLTALATAGAQSRLLAALAWFVEVAGSPNPSE
jgi:alkylated DNA nucleotide flippase Atl1